jgi:hypothetical protein
MSATAGRAGTIIHFHEKIGGGDGDGGTGCFSIFRAVFFCHAADPLFRLANAACSSGLKSSEKISV